MSGDSAHISLCSPNDEAVSPVEGFPGITAAPAAACGVVGAAELDDVAGLDLDGPALSGVDGGNLDSLAAFVAVAIADGIGAGTCGEDDAPDRLGAIDDLDRARECDIEWVDDDAI